MSKEVKLKHGKNQTNYQQKRKKLCNEGLEN